MKVPPERLGQHLRRGLAPVYLVGGDEPLLVQEAVDAIRSAAREHGFDEREVLFADAGFDWQALSAAAANPSLFARRRLLELRLPGARPGDSGAQALIRHAARPPEDLVLLVTLGVVDAAARNSKWYKAIDEAGVVVPVWPLKPREFPRWLSIRLKAQGMTATAEAQEVLVQRTEGNLLAAKQEVEKLAISHDGGLIDVDAVLSVADSARFDVFGVCEAALLADMPRLMRQCLGLQAEGTEPVLMLWALVRDLRLVAQLAARVDRGVPIAKAMAEMRVWERRKAVLERAVARRPAAEWRRLLWHAGRVEWVIKGAAPGRPWDEMIDLLGSVAGACPVRPSLPPA